MSRAATRVGVGTRFRYDGESVEVVEMAATMAGNEFEFLQTKWRTVQHYGVEIGRRRYSGPGLPEPGVRSPCDSPVKNGWPFQVDPDDITRIYFRDPTTRAWHTLVWEHAPSAEMKIVALQREPSGR